jgi:hypothetical protein
MFSIINDINHALLEFIRDDPVRPEIPVDFRVSDGRVVAALSDDPTKPSALVCISFHDTVPGKVEDLNMVASNPTTAVFYSIWSYVPGAGRELLLNAVSYIEDNFPSVTRFVTLSPKTELAKRFHLKNGAIILQENENTINYEYVRG